MPPQGRALPPRRRPLLHACRPRHGRDRDRAVGRGAGRGPRAGQPVGTRGARALDQRAEPARAARRGWATVCARAQRAADQQGSRASRRCRSRSGPARTDRAHRRQPARAGVRAAARSASGFRSRCITPRPRCRDGSSCCATRRSIRARPNTCSSCWNGRWPRRPATASSSATPHQAARSAVARSSICARRSAGGARRSGAPRSTALAERDPAKALARVLAGPNGWIDLDAFCRDRAIGPATAARLEADLALVILPAGNVRAGHAAAALGAAARAHRPHARCVPCRAAGPAGHRPRAPAQG